METWCLITLQGYACLWWHFDHLSNCSPIWEKHRHRDLGGSEASVNCLKIDVWGMKKYRGSEPLQIPQPGDECQSLCLLRGPNKSAQPDGNGGTLTEILLLSYHKLQSIKKIILNYYWEVICIFNINKWKICPFRSNLGNFNQHFHFFFFRTTQFLNSWKSWNNKLLKMRLFCCLCSACCSFD